MGNRVVIVCPCAMQLRPEGDVNRQTMLGPLLLATILKRSGFAVRFLNEAALGRDIEPSDLDADWLALSLLTRSVKRGYEIARRFRELNPSGQVIAGGYHPTFMPEEALQHADYVVTGEAESMIVDLLKHGSDEKVVEGRPVEDLDALPMPDYSLLAGHLPLRSVPILTSRGCPNHCTFCLGPAMFGRKLRTQSIERVVEEMSVREYDEVELQEFDVYDDNFNWDIERLRAILDALAKRPPRAKWRCHVTASIGQHEEVIARLRGAGCISVAIGFESLNAESLRQMRKGQTVEGMAQAVRLLRKHGVFVDGSFVFGYDADTPEELLKTVGFCLRHRLNTVHFAIATPFPGTELAAKLEAEGRILSRDWDLYDAIHVVFQPAGMSPDQLQATSLEAFRRYTGCRTMVGDALRLLVDLLSSPAHWRHLCASATRRMRWKRSLHSALREMSGQAPCDALETA